MVAGLGRERYISLTSYRRDGSAVATPVWVVADGRRLYVWTGWGTGKVRRIRANPAVTMAPCTARGRLTGPVAPAKAAIVAMADRPDVWPMFQAKYGVQIRAIRWGSRLRRALRRAPPAPDGQIYLEIIPAG